MNKSIFAAKIDEDSQKPWKFFEIAKGYHFELIFRLLSFSKKKGMSAAML